MNLYWTSKEDINGLRHFVLVNELVEKNKNYLVLVSVLDDQVNLKIPKLELDNSEKWEVGWSELMKSESITEKYLEFKKSIVNSEIEKVHIFENSVFNIS